MSANRVVWPLRKLLLLGKSLVYYFVLSVPLDFSSVTIVMESILSQFLLCSISSDSHQEPVVAEDVDPGEQVTYTAISGSVSEEASENS